LLVLVCKATMQARDGATIERSRITPQKREEDYIQVSEGKVHAATTFREPNSSTIVNSLSHRPGRLLKFDTSEGGRPAPAVLWVLRRWRLV